jgi:hypothetical protein
MSILYYIMYFSDDCCLIPNQIMIPQVHQANSITAIATPILFYQSFPLQVKLFLLLLKINLIYNNVL